MPTATDPAVQQCEAIHRDATRICLTLNAMDHPPAALLDMAVETQQEAERMLASARRAARVRADLAAAEELALEDYDEPEHSPFRQWQQDVTA